MTKREGGMQRPAHERIREVAREMFYRQDIRAVGVDAIVAEAGATKRASIATSPRRTRWWRRVWPTVSPASGRGSRACWRGIRRIRGPAPGALRRTRQACDGKRLPRLPHDQRRHRVSRARSSRSPDRRANKHELRSRLTQLAQGPALAIREPGQWLLLLSRAPTSSRPSGRAVLRARWLALPRP